MFIFVAAALLLINCREAQSPAATPVVGCEESLSECTAACDTTSRRCKNLCGSNFDCVVPCDDAQLSCRYRCQYDHKICQGAQ
jgi:hypothetical protein